MSNNFANKYKCPYVFPAGCSLRKYLHFKYFPFKNFSELFLRLCQICQISKNHPTRVHLCTAVCEVLGLFIWAIQLKLLDWSRGVLYSHDYTGCTWEACNSIWILSNIRSISSSGSTENSCTMVWKLFQWLFHAALFKLKTGFRFQIFAKCAYTCFSLQL